jgi:pyruvate dehydrogenase kinase 2/3/4
MAINTLRMLRPRSGAIAQRVTISSACLSDARPKLSAAQTFFMDGTCHRASSSRSQPERDKDQIVPVSRSRLDQLLETEITSLALREPKPLTLQSILELASSTDSAGLAQLLYEELPVRFAQRVKMIEALPDWQSKKSISNVRAMYVTSFKELRLIVPSEPEQFAAQIRAIKERHSHTNLLTGGFKEYVAVDEMGEEKINDWLDRFFALRISTNMLMSHYLQISRKLQVTSLSDPLEMKNAYRGYVDPECQPARIAEHAAEMVRRLCRLRYGLAPVIIVTDCGAKAFPFVPRYLFYVFSEVLKNSARATIEFHVSESLDSDGHYSQPDWEEAQEALPPIKILVSGDNNVCSIRISDGGGGIPIDRLNHVWSYLYTSAEPIQNTVSRLAVDDPADLSELDNERSLGFARSVPQPKWLPLF